MRLKHRLQNPADLRYFREIVPGIYGQMLDQLPALAPRSALVLGECVQAPALVEIREASPVPKSKNPKFFKSWTQDEKQPDFEAVCEKWEGKQAVCLLLPISLVRISIMAVRESDIVRRFR